MAKVKWSHLRHRFQLISLFFVSWQSDHFWLRYSKSHIWPWKFKVKVQCGKLNFLSTRPKTEVYTKFNLPRPIFCSPTSKCTRIGERASVSFPHWGHSKNRPKSNEVICRSGPLIQPKMKGIWKFVQNLSCEQKCVDCGGSIRTGTKT